MRFLKLLVKFSREKSLATTLIIIFLFFSFLFVFEKPLVYSVLLTTEAIQNFPVHPLNILGYKVLKEEVSYYSSGKKIRAFIYRPKAKGLFPVMVFSVGATKYGVDDPQLDRFSYALAKVGIIAFAPDVPLLKEEVVLKESITDYISAYNFIYDQPYVNKSKVGFAGFCVGGSLSFVAATNKAIHDKVAYIVLISPYFDNLKAVMSVITRTNEVDGKVEKWMPHPQSIEIVRNGFIAFLHDPDERKLLRNLLIEDKKVLSDEDNDNLSDYGKLIFETFQTRDRTKFLEIYNSFPDEGKENFKELSPKYVVSDLNKNTKVFLLVDKHDSYVPESETIDFQKNVPISGFSEVDSYAHARPGVGLPRFKVFVEFGKLFLFLHGVLKVVI